MILLWLTTMLPQAWPPLFVNFKTECNSSTTSQVIILCFSLGLTSIGVEGIQSASMAFGADQFVKRYSKQTSMATFESYFGWYYAPSVYAASVLAVVGKLVLVFLLCLCC